MERGAKSWLTRKPGLGYSQREDEWGPSATDHGSISLPRPPSNKDEQSMNLDEAVVLRTFASEAVASIAAARLGSEGIEAHIQKDDCGGAYPSLQVSGGVRLLVKPEDLADAEKILDGMDVEGFGEVEEEEQPEERRRTQSSSTLWVGLFLVGLFLLGVLAGNFLSLELTDQSTYTGVVKSERYADGKASVFNHYVNGKLTRVEEDRNHDGKPDGWHEYVADKLVSSRFDNNFDGKPDTWVTYKDRFNYVEKRDTDFDGKPDATVSWVNGLCQRVDWHPHDSANIDRRQYYEHGVLKEELVDTDGDGIFDQKITYDQYERPIAQDKCWIPNYSDRH
jgi:hypothetical protein